MIDSTPEIETDERESAVTCIFCGKPVNPETAVRYMDWICHPNCMNRTKDERIEGFDERYFIFGAIGCVIGILGSFIIISTQPAISEPIISNPISLYFNVGISHALLAIGMLIHSFGLYGLHRNYTQSLGLLSVGIAIVNTVFFSGMSVLYFTYGMNPDFHDPETGRLLVEEILLYSPLVLTSIFLFGILSVIVATTILMLEKELKATIPSVIISIILIANVGVFLILPHSIVIYFGLLFWFFITQVCLSFGIRLRKRSQSNLSTEKAELIFRFFRCSLCDMI